MVAEAGIAYGGVAAKAVRADKVCQCCACACACVRACVCVCVCVCACVLACVLCACFHV